MLFQFATLNGISNMPTRIIFDIPDDTTVLAIARAVVQLGCMLPPAQRGEPLHAVPDPRRRAPRRDGAGRREVR